MSILENYAIKTNSNVVVESNTLVKSKDESVSHMANNGKFAQQLVIEILRSLAKGFVVINE